MPDHPRGGRGILWATGAGASAVAVCCTVHALLLTGGLAGASAALGAAIGNTVLLAGAGAILATVAGVVLARLRRCPDHQAKPPSPEGQERP